MKILKILLFSYVAWVFFWLAMAFVTAAPGPVWLLLFPPNSLYYLVKLYAFLWGPMLVAALFSIVLVMLLNRLSHNLELKTFLSVACFLGLSVIFGEFYLDYRIRQLLPAPKPECIIEKSFLNAIGWQSDAYRHTVFAYQGSVYRWSYAMNDFYRSPTALFTLRCTPEHEEYWSAIKRRFEQRDQKSQLGK